MKALIVISIIASFMGAILTTTSYIDYKRKNKQIWRKQRN